MTKTLHRPDSELKSAVVDELMWTPEVNSAHIGVSVNDGAVTLSGEVDSFPEKRLAGKVAERVHGVTAIAQEITVNNTWNAVTDTDIARGAGEAVERAVDVPDTVKVSVHNRVVTLTGTVPWHFQHEAAERTVHHIKGVKEVVNNVLIRPTASPVDIRAGITAALVRNAQLDGRKIGVETDDAGVVTLEGTIGSWAERRQAKHSAWAAPGVTGVVDHLRISY
ncbi:BON domain-containing protein [Umezawaea sp. Da 62-37]|uniref:BON domain-containing protein n=1 Tax=Umezawaea sp. Da 62-37 TaxID=3075927 RepID=UPI0028F6F187|nr:BON domain-containing protein [Umezawaea sp. Da 62-37]WNV84824.1 BON domain-containing protein [Umezawaea sp. Da 62-37]